MTSTVDLLRQNFTEACASRDAILAMSGPLRAQRDQVIADATATLAAIVGPLDARIAATESGLPALMNEIASIAVALNGQTAAQ
jgi:hypothetical protein